MSTRICLIITFVLSSMTGLAQGRLIDSLVVEGVPSWWNVSTQLNPLRLPPPPSGSVIRYYDLTGNGKPDLLRAETANGVAIQWIDDNNNMRIGDISGDLTDDCLMIDRNGDGQFGAMGDLVVDWVDTDNDGEADIQIIADYPQDESLSRKGHFMMVFDTDKDNVFNYIDWNTFALRCWLHDGSSDFFEDYHGNSTFLKVHNSPNLLNDVRLNWENPFRFIDSDNDGLTEMTIRLCDKDGSPSGKRDPSGVIDWAAISVDLDNDNDPANPFDLDMTINFTSRTGTPYTKYSHKYAKLRGLPEADALFMDPSWRMNTELIFPYNDECFEFIFKDAEWDCVNFTFDEDDDCNRWERVELYQPNDLYPVGANKGGLDNHRQSDAVGDRGEWDLDNSGKGNIYVSPIDGKIHLYGAEWGAWRIDQNASSYQGMGGIYDLYGPGRQQKEYSGAPVIMYEDRDRNGFIDSMRFDWDGDGSFEEEVSLIELGIPDSADVIDISKYRVKDYNKLFKKVAKDQWNEARTAKKVAEKLGLDTRWYALYLNPKSIRQQYHFGYWLQIYIYHDIVDKARRDSDLSLEEKATRAYYSSCWKKML